MIGENMATHRGEALTMIPVMVDEEPLFWAYRKVKIEYFYFQALLAPRAGPSREEATRANQIWVFLVKFFFSFKSHLAKMAALSGGKSSTK